MLKWTKQTLLQGCLCVSVCLNLAAMWAGPSVGSAMGELEPANAHDEADPFLYDREMQLYWNSEQCCGIVSAFLAMRLNGLDCSVDDVAAHIHVSAEGASMHDIEQYLTGHGLSVLSVEMTHDEFTECLNRSTVAYAIGLFDESHWALTSQSAGGIQIATFPQWESLPVEEVQERFSGKAILIQRPDSMLTLAQHRQLALSLRFVGIVILLLIVLVGARRVVVRRAAA